MSIMAANDSAGSSGAKRNDRQAVLTWAATIAACAYFAWMGASLSYSTSMFMKMFESMGVDLALSTKIVIGSFHWLYPILFGGASALVIAKQFFVRDKWPNLGVTLAVVVGVDIASRVIVSALYAPLFDLIEKLNK